MEPRRALRVNRLAWPITALGPGRRVGLWVQGCTIGCLGCASRDTWDPAAGTAIEIAELAARIATLIAADDLDGVTLTGGEPFQQGPALAELVGRLRELGVLDGRDVLAFTGYPSARAQVIAPALWEVVDALVCGPYLPHRPGDGWLCASGNQELVLRTERAQMRYVDPERPVVQVASTGASMTLAGLPAPGDLDRFRSLMRERGIEFGEVSWEG